MEQWHGWVKFKVLDGLHSDSLINILLEGQVETFTKQLGEAIMCSFSYHDVGGSKLSKVPESFYHGFFLCLTFMGREAGYLVDSNKEAGLGGFDIMIQPPSDKKDARAVVIELKVVKDKKYIKREAGEALEQIKNNMYRTSVASWVDEVVEYGIAFCGKNVYATSRIAKRQDFSWGEEEVKHYDIYGLFSQSTDTL